MIYLPCGTGFMIKLSLKKLLRMACIEIKNTSQAHESLPQ